MAGKLLLHVCCGPCAIFPLAQMRKHGYDVTLYFYNPNIHPYKEMRKRLEYVQKFAYDEQAELIIRDSYAEFDEVLLSFLQAGSERRCSICYQRRLQITAEFAKTNGYDAFSTSLLVSPYQKHDVILAAGELAADLYNTKFVGEDFRNGWQEAVQKAVIREYYRQPYCGCILSERDRYYKKKKVQK